MVNWEAAGMTAEKKAARHRQWAANAIADAMRVDSEADRETLMMIARQHLAVAQEAEHSAARAASKAGSGVLAHKNGEDTPTPPTADR
jgi:hypothetical protein